MRQTMLARVRATVSDYHQRLRATDSIRSLFHGRGRHSDAVVRVLGPLVVGVSLIGIKIPSPPSVTVEKPPQAQIVQMVPPGPQIADLFLRENGMTPAAPKPAQAPVDPEHPERAAIHAIINQTAKEEGVDPSLVRAVVNTESEFNPNAISHSGAVGLMQLMPETAQDFGVADRWDPAQNVRGGTRYLRQLLDQFQDKRLAVAAYNAGAGSVKRYGGIPPYHETQRYVQKVLAYQADEAAGRTI